MAEEKINIQYSAPGKMIISGEHSVVYGKDALVAAINLRTYVTLNELNERNEENVFIIDLQDTKNQYYIKRKELNELEVINEKLLEENVNYEDIRQMLGDSGENFVFVYAIFQSIVAAVKEIKISVKSEIPLSKGLGSSASFSVALSGVLLDFSFRILQCTKSEKILSFEEFQFLTNKLAYNLEKIYHATPSGMDNTIATYGGLLIYNRLYQERNQKILKTDLFQGFDIILVDSNIEKNTKKSVLKVKAQVEDNVIGQSATSLIDSIGQVSTNIINIFQQGNKDQLESLSKLIRMNHYLLCAIGLGNIQVENIIQIGMQYNLNGKITGSGEGGFCFVFIQRGIDDENAQKFLEDIHSKQFLTYRLAISDVGLNQEILFKSSLQA